MKCTFFSLLHVAPAELSAMNVKVKNFDQQILIYLENAVSFSKSLRRINAQLVLLTNDKKRIDVLLQKHDYELNVEEIAFSTVVPTGIRFYSAHFKFDVIKYLSGLRDGGYYVFCDSDMLCVNDANSAFIYNVNAGVPMYYDISDQTPVSFVARCADDMAILLDSCNDGRWAGGEFLSGTSEFFSLVENEVGLVYGKYVLNIDKFAHVGDEMVMSVVLERLRRAGVNLVNAGTVGIIGRYWSGDVLHVQNNFNYFRGLMLLHLPADKVFLASLASENDLGANSLKRYSAYLSSWSLRVTSILRSIRRQFLKARLG